MFLKCTATDIFPSKHKLCFLNALQLIYSPVNRSYVQEIKATLTKNAMHFMITVTPSKSKWKRQSIRNCINTKWKRQSIHNCINTVSFAQCSIYFKKFIFYISLVYHALLYSNVVWVWWVWVWWVFWGG